MKRCKVCMSENKDFVVDVSRNDVICRICGAVQMAVPVDACVSVRHACSTTGDISSMVEFTTTVSRLHGTNDEDRLVVKLVREFGGLLDASDSEIANTISLFTKNISLRMFKPISTTVVAVLVILKRENGTLAEFNVRKVEELTRVRIGDRLVKVANVLSRDTIKDPVQMIPMVISRIGLPQRYNKFLKSIYIRKLDYYTKNVAENARRPSRSTVFAVVVYMFFQANKEKSTFGSKVDIDFIAEITQTTVTNIKRFITDQNNISANPKYECSKIG